ncbi:hypothetical protein [Actinoplanes couchii]|uniref:Uncharacterized protein n=1 Tax=Actinoplanes couchii TaxID=403638 RepID=A0ABQ3XQQ5_9ACTN|nr:hypothetical protein [Actinoplanes couchii]MDR6317434.1 hypothetical protein [Actinoplanes couchii]GID60735.1 hypothetical protein Aco03nite_091390 [Actinoplanes couchii]
MFDPALVIAWTATALERSRSPVPEPAAPLLQALIERIRQQLGTDALRDLAADPGDPEIRAHLQARLERAAYYDPAFTRDLTHLQQDIDQQKLVNRYTPSTPAPMPGGFPDPDPGRWEVPALGSGPATPPASADRPLSAALPSHGMRIPRYSRNLIVLGTLISVLCLVNLVALMNIEGSWDSPLPGALPTLAALVTGLLLLAAGVATARPARRR